MRTTLITVLIFNSSILFGQSKWELIGKYEHSVFMYSYTLSLTTSDSYEIVESSDLGSETTIGTWRILGQAIRLTPKKKITVDQPGKPVERIISYAREEVVVIESKNILKPEYRDFRLQRVK